LAAITNAVTAQKKAIQKTNIDETKTFIHQCLKSKCLFIFPSSTSVYGKSADTVYEDNSYFINPQSFYATAKYKIEQYISNNLKNFLILRLGTVTGVSPGIRFETAINSFCYKAAFNQPLIIWKENYFQKRPYLSLYDLTTALYRLIEKSSYWNNTYNVVTQNTKLYDIIKYIQSIIPIKKKFVHTPLLNQFSYIVSNDKLQSTNWQPQYSIEQCIRDILVDLLNLETNNAT
jgi:nucleoside-diphosphate-sugar epimerase